MEAIDFIWAGWFLIFVIPPLLLKVICNMLRFWSRGSFDKSLGLSYQCSMYKLLPKGYKPEKENGNGDFWRSYLSYNLFIGVILTCVLGEIVTEVSFQTMLNSGIIVGIILTGIFLPRFILDLCKGLKVNHKTGDLEEINSLKKRLEELESKEEK